MMNRCLLGEGYDNALEYLKHLINLDVIEIPSGTKLGTWTVPDEWIVRDAWVKYKGEKILDYKKDPMSLVVGSTPFHGVVSLEELRNHWHYSDERPDSIPYNFKFYDKDWGFCFKKTDLKEKIIYDEQGNIICEGGQCFPDLKDIDPDLGKVTIEGVDYKPKFKDRFEEGEYEVFIDTEYRPGTMKLGVHTVQGKKHDREILIFAHLDHPFQANDNLSSVACAVDFASKIRGDYNYLEWEVPDSLRAEGLIYAMRKQYDHTIKIIFCPETIGSIAYAMTQDISKVDFVVALECVGNKNSLLLQKPYNAEDRLYRVSHVAIQGLGESYRQGMFRNVIGSDEYFFNDPLVNIPGILLSRFPFDEYHTNDDTPDKIDDEMIDKTTQALMRVIDVYETDYIPVRNFKGPLMRSKYGIQIYPDSKQFHLSWDYFIFAMDGKRSLAELCCEYGLNYEYTYEIMEKMIHDKAITRIDIGKRAVLATSGQEHAGLQGSADVRSKPAKKLKMPRKGVR